MPQFRYPARLALSALLLGMCPAMAAAQEVPNLVGTWTGTITGGARFGELNHDPAVKDPVFADRKREWTLTIAQQDGSGLIGSWSTDKKTEKLVGAIRQDNVTVIFADEDNTFDARLLSANTMELCAVEAEEATIAVCYQMTRK